MGPFTEYMEIQKEITALNIEWKRACDEVDIHRQNMFYEMTKDLKKKQAEIKL